MAVLDRDPQPSTQRRPDAVATVPTCRNRTPMAARRAVLASALLVPTLAGLFACETTATADAQNAIGQAAADVLIAHGRCTSLADCGTRGLLVTTPSRSAGVLEVFDVEDASLALEIATACGRLLGSTPNLGRIEVDVHRPAAPRRQPARGERPRSGTDARGWAFTYRTL